MSLDKIRLSDRAEMILRKDRNALLFARHEEKTPVLLTLVPDRPAILALMDAYIPPIAQQAGLQYMRLVGPNVREVPRSCLSRTRMVIADLSGRDEDVITLLYQCFGEGRRILICTQDRSHIPLDLEEVRSVQYNLADRDVDDLLREARDMAARKKRVSAPAR